MKQADKGGNIVLMTQEGHIKMYKKIIDNLEWYRRVDMTFLTACTTKFTELVIHAFNDDLINKDTRDYLLIKTSK